MKQHSACHSEKREPGIAVLDGSRELPRRISAAAQGQRRPGSLDAITQRRIEPDGEEENGSYRKRHEFRMDPGPKFSGDGDATRRHPRRNCGKNAPDRVTRQVVWIALTIIKEERERWTVVCARSPVNSPGNPCHEEIAAIGARLRSLNQINIRDSEGTKKMYVRR